jgi:hypothetical protein
MLIKCHRHHPNFGWCLWHFTPVRNNLCYNAKRPAGLTCCRNITMHNCPGQRIRDGSYPLTTYDDSNVAFCKDQRISPPEFALSKPNPFNLKFFSPIPHCLRLKTAVAYNHNDSLRLNDCFLLERIPPDISFDPIVPNL